MKQKRHEDVASDFLLLLKENLVLFHFMGVFYESVR